MWAIFWLVECTVSFSTRTQVSTFLCQPVIFNRNKKKKKWNFHAWQQYCNVLGVLYSWWNFIALQKPETLGTRVRVRPARSRNTHSYRILPTGPLVAIFQHSLPFLQSQSFQTHVGTIYRRAIGPLAHHNGTSAYTSLTRHLPAPTIGCLYRPP
jgi:hypothetical protein